MLQEALANRTDLAVEKANLEASEVSALGTRNGILPSLQVFGGESQAGLAGVRRTITQNGQPVTADAYFDGDIGTGLGQIFRRNYPTERLGVFHDCRLTTGRPRPISASISFRFGKPSSAIRRISARCKLTC